MYTGKMSTHVKHVKDVYRITHIKHKSDLFSKNVNSWIFMQWIPLKDVKIFTKLHLRNLNSFGDNEYL